MENEKIIYQLSTNDILNVANQEINRNLSDNEILRLVDYIEKHIDWYNIIANGINEFSEAS